MIMIAVVMLMIALVTPFAFGFILPRYMARSTIFHSALNLAEDEGVVKKTLRPGDFTKGYPQPLDTIEIAWRFYADETSSTIIHSSSTLDENFSFTLGVEPREVIKGWELAVRNMYEGEVAHLTIQPNYGFGEKGAPPLFKANQVLYCELEILEIIPSIKRTYKELDASDSIGDEVLQGIEDGSSVIAKEAIENKQINGTKSDKERVFFDPSKHHVAADERVEGSSSDGAYVWTETMSSIDVDIKLDQRYTKNDLVVTLKTDYISIRLQDGRVLFEGPLDGKIDPSQSMWALMEPEPLARVRGYYLSLSLEKSYGHRDIWASVLSKEFMINNS